MAKKLPFFKNIVKAAREKADRERQYIRKGRKCQEEKRFSDGKGIPLFNVFGVSKGTLLKKVSAFGVGGAALLIAFVFTGGVFSPL